MNEEPEKLLWPDDERLQTDRDGVLARTHGRYRYFISENLLLEHPELLHQHRASITAHILESGGGEPVELMTYNYEAIIGRRLPSVKTKLDTLLRALAVRTNFQVEKLLLTRPADSFVYGLAREAGLSGQTELRSLLEYAHSQGLLDLQIVSNAWYITTTIPGLIYVESLERPNRESRNGFVAMWFASEMNEAYENGVKPAIESNGFESVRIDSREHNNKIDDEIIAEIRRARFVVADFSCGEGGARGGVYFEAGFALGLGIPVIWCVRQSDLSRVHFDTRQFNHIVWSDPEDLRIKLTSRIGATIGIAN